MNDIEKMIRACRDYDQVEKLLSDPDETERARKIVSSLEDKDD